MAAVRHLEFSKFGIWLSDLCQTWSCFLIYKFRINRTINRWHGRPQYWICKFWYFARDNKIIFKMAAVRHLEFTKFGILVTWPVSERYYTSSYQISHQSDNKSLIYNQKTIFNMAAVRHFEFAKFWYFFMWPFLERESASEAYQILLKTDDSRSRYSDKTIFKNGSRPPSWIFKIWHFDHVTCV